jgi:alpha-1,3/alpha-1,6-mannosyltransferase
MPSVAFIHLDLGIGGAENLVINAAKGLQEKGFSVNMFTSHHDGTRAFKETTDGTLKV